MKVCKISIGVLCTILVVAIGMTNWWNRQCSIINISPSEVSKIQLVDSNTGKTTIITNTADIQHVIGNLNAVSLKKDKLSLGSNDFIYKAKIYKTDGKLYKEFMISSNGTLRKDPFVYQTGSNGINYKLIQQLTAKKLLMCKSPDGKNVAYLVKSNRENQEFDNICVENYQTGRRKVINLENIVYTSELKLEWIDNNYLAFTGHINPSLEIYVMLDLNLVKMVSRYYGIGFSQDIANLHTYYTLPQPHFSEECGNCKIYEDSKIVYESNKNTEIIGGPAVNERGTRFVFFEKEIKSDKVSLVVAEKQKDDKLKVSKKIRWNKAIGNVVFAGADDDTVDIRMDLKTNDLKFNIKTATIVDKSL